MVFLPQRYRFQIFFFFFFSFLLYSTQTGDGHLWWSVPVRTGCVCCHEKRDGKSAKVKRSREPHVRVKLQMQILLWDQKIFKDVVPTFQCVQPL